MALKSYILKQDIRVPSTKVRQLPNRPPQVCTRTFRKGEVVYGEIKHVNNKPEVLLARGGFVFPVSVIQELVTKEVISNASGAGEGQKEEKSAVSAMIAPAKNNKLKYLDAIIIGAVIGFGGVYLAEKQGWIPAVDKKNRFYGAAAGAALLFYLAYRHTQNKKLETPKE